MDDRSFLSLFAQPKPILAMLHLKGDTVAETDERMKREIDAYMNGGVDAIIVENYFGTYSAMCRALDYIREQKLDVVLGINCLNVDWVGVDLAARYNADFAQFDSVVGHVKPRDEESVAEFFRLARERFSGKILGGVRFKYQPMLSENDLATDLGIAKTRCDAVCVTQDATGQETSLTKIAEFRDGLGEFPLIVGAGVTPENMREAFKLADGAIVGSYFKDTYKDTGDVDPAHVAQIMDAVRSIRSEL